MWSFETDPEFQASLDWIDEFTKNEIEPLDLVFREPGDPWDPNSPAFAAMVLAARGGYLSNVTNIIALCCAIPNATVRSLEVARVSGITSAFSDTSPVISSIRGPNLR